MGAMRARGPAAHAVSGDVTHAWLRREGPSLTILFRNLAVILVGSAREDSFGMPPP